MPGRADANVEAHGEEVDHEFVVDYDLDANGQVDPASIVTEREPINAIVSTPTEEDEQRLEGRLPTGSLKLTVPSDRDVQANRGGRRDRIFRGGRPYQVVDVQDDEHPFTGTTKQTVLVEQLGGRRE